MVLLKSGRVSLEMTKTKMLPRPLYLGLSRHTWALGLSRHTWAPNICNTWRTSKLIASVPQMLQTTCSSNLTKTYACGSGGKVSDHGECIRKDVGQE